MSMSGILDIEILVPCIGGSVASMSVGLSVFPQAFTAPPSGYHSGGLLRGNIVEMMIVVNTLRSPKCLDSVELRDPPRAYAGMCSLHRGTEPIQAVSRPKVFAVIISRIFWRRTLNDESLIVFISYIQK